MFLQEGSCKIYLQGGSPPLHPGVHFLSRGKELNKFNSDERRAKNLLVP